MKIQNVDLWEAWIDMQSTGKSCAGTLYVTGDVTTNNLIIEPKFVKKQSSFGSPYELSLEITPCSIMCEDGYVNEVFYTEDLLLVDQYSMITIYAGNELVAVITEIEKLL